MMNTILNSFLKVFFSERIVQKLETAEKRILAGIFAFIILAVLYLFYSLISGISP